MKQMKAKSDKHDATVVGPASIRSEGPRTVTAGFIPLVDASVLIAAAEFGFARREGIALTLVRDVSWANIRDRLAFRQFDIAHMLSPMPIASRLGLGSNPSPSITPFSLGRGGNAITLSEKLYRRMEQRAGLGESEDALANARALKLVINERRAAGQPLLTFGMTYPFSSHNYELRYWLAAGGIHPDRDVKLVVVPPPLTSDALIAGAIDGFCVGAPWNMVAVDRGVGRIVAVKQDIWPSSPEKVIGTRPEWAEEHPETLSRLIVALDAAARWCDVPENRPMLAEALADARYIGAPIDILRRVLLGEFTVDPSGKQRRIPDYFVFHAGAANFPWVSQALWIYSQMLRWGQARYSEKGCGLASSSYRPDLYCGALGLSAFDDRRIGGASAGDRFIDGAIFDPTGLSSYVESFDIRARDHSLAPAAGPMEEI
jgi:ABC-type nitrate/sulfonate/bicarbonate transport system substrate-binding protein